MRLFILGILTILVGCKTPHPAVKALEGTVKKSEPLAANSLLLDPSKTIEKLAFSSRANPAKPEIIWQFIAAEKPDLFISTGDMIEPNVGTARDIQANYRLLSLQPEFAHFRSHFALLGNWGIGDSGEIAGDTATKEIAKLEYVKFYLSDSQFIDPRQGGIYHGIVIGPAQQRLHLIFLDTHFFKSWGVDGGTLLGNEQWSWLMTEIQKPSDLTILVTSDSILAESKSTSAWPAFPKEKKKLLDLLKIYGKLTKQKSIFTITNTGFGETRKLPLSKDLSLTEFAAGGLNRKSPTPPEASKLRVGTAIKSFNYALIKIDWKNKFLKSQFLSDEPTNSKTESWKF